MSDHQHAFPPDGEAIDKLVQALITETIRIGKRDGMSLVEITCAAMEVAARVGCMGMFPNVAQAGLSPADHRWIDGLANNLKDRMTERLIVLTQSGHLDAIGPVRGEA